MTHIASDHKLETLLGYIWETLEPCHGWNLPIIGSLLGVRRGEHGPVGYQQPFQLIQHWRGWTQVWVG